MLNMFVSSRFELSCDLAFFIACLRLSTKTFSLFLFKCFIPCTSGGSNARWNKP